MLVLSRKKGESIIIGDEIELIVLDTEGDTVSLGIQAPKHVDVFRKEIYEMIQQSNQEASQSVLNPAKIRKMIKK